MPEDWMTETARGAENLTDATQRLRQEAVRRQAFHTDGRVREMLPRLDGSELARFLGEGFEPDLSDDGADPLLAPMYLPEGWHRQRTDHHLYDHLVDANGANRVLIMLKDTAYDRDAWMRLL